MKKPPPKSTSSQKKYVPERGDVVWLDFHPQQGHEQSGRRPAVILSPARYNGTVGLAIVCPVTSQVKNYPFEVALPENCSVQGVVLSDQIKSLDWRARNAIRKDQVAEAVVQQIVELATTLLAADKPA